MLRQKLREEQKPIFDKAESILNRYGMVYIAAEPRTGKSYIASALINKSRALICTVKSAMDGWKETADFMKIDAVIVNYESLHKVGTETFDYLIIDEAPKIAKYPTPSKARKELDRFVHPNIKLIWLSGTPSIETDAQMFYQLSLSPRHSFNQYYKKGNSSAFNHWYWGGAYYSTRPDSLPGYGLGTMKVVGYNKEAIDYAAVKNFSHKFEPIVVRHYHIEEAMSPNMNVVYIEAPTEVMDVYEEIKTNKCSLKMGISPMKPAQIQSKLLQIASGTVITDDSQLFLNGFKADQVFKEHPNAAVFYKFVADRDNLIRAGFSEEQLFQIDSKIMGLDLSHFNEQVIYSLTFSGMSFTQAVSRLCNVDRKDRPNVYVYLTKGTIEEDVYATVSKKRDYNSQFLRK